MHFASAGPCMANLPTPPACQLDNTPSLYIDLCSSQCQGCTQHAHGMPRTDSCTIQCILICRVMHGSPSHPHPGQLNATPSLGVDLCRWQLLGCTQHARDMPCTGSRKMQCTLLLQGRALLPLPAPPACQPDSTPFLDLAICRLQCLGCNQHAHDMPCTDYRKITCTLLLQGHAWLPLPPQPPGQLDMTPSLHLALCRSQCLGCTQHVNMTWHVLTLAISSALCMVAHGSPSHPQPQFS